jgi:hypothetical protein
MGQIEHCFGGGKIGHLSPPVAATLPAKRRARKAGENGALRVVIGTRGLFERNIISKQIIFSQ